MLRRSMTGNVVWVAMALVVGGWRSASAQQRLQPGPATVCQAGTIETKQAEFQRLLVLKRLQPWAVSDESLRAASAAYVASAQACFGAFHGPATTFDDGPMIAEYPDGVAPFGTIGAKWGTGGWFTGGVDVRGPGTPGGTVSYSFMGTGVNMGSHSDANQAITSLPGFQACFLTEIRNAFAAWSAVANIQFVEVADNGAPFDAGNARGDIRVGAHRFDGGWGALAHAYYPGGTSASGDVHFDREETYSCTVGAGTVDIGIVAMHEIGHAIGLAHETRLGHTALMNPYYNPVSAPMLLADDVEGVASIYGVGVVTSDSVVANFGPEWGLWDLSFGRGWQAIEGQHPRIFVTGDLDGNGVHEVVASVEGDGLWIRWNNTTWTQLYAVAPAKMAVGDLDGNGRGDLFLSFEGLGLFVWQNATSWARLSEYEPLVMATGNVDGAGGEDLVATFPGRGIWIFTHTSGWSNLHRLDASGITIGHLDGPFGAADILFTFEGLGLWRCLNLSTWTWLHRTAPVRIALGSLDGDSLGDAVIDFGSAIGIWTLTNGSSWAGLHTAPSDSITLGDFDGNGQSDIVVDFGQRFGLWIYMNGRTWIQGHGDSPNDVAVADLK